MDRTTKTITLRVSDQAFAELTQLSSRFDRPIFVLVRDGLALVKLFLEEKEANNNLVVATPEGKAIREVVLPERPTVSNGQPTTMQPVPVG
jgi:hypothetical protein